MAEEIIQKKSKISISSHHFTIFWYKASDSNAIIVIKLTKEIIRAWDYCAGQAHLSGVKSFNTLNCQCLLSRNIIFK